MSLAHDLGTITGDLAVLVRNTKSESLGVPWWLSG